MDQISDYRLAAGTLVMWNAGLGGDDYILLLRRSTKETSFHGLWELPGGKVENGENPLNTAITELFEETGIKVEPELAIDSRHGFFAPHRDHDMKKIYYAFLIPLNPSEHCGKFYSFPTIELSEEHDDYVWLPLEKAIQIEPLSHHAHYFLTELLK